ncbi:hypothetical protein [Pseudomonas shirazensis]|uniref:hypothetical protein n=1 Tax=Pseudomonas shirazensis TaxID=2745494 RepID=UPI003D2707FD
MTGITVVKADSELEIEVAREIETEFQMRFKSASRRRPRFHTKTHIRFHMPNKPESIRKLEEFNAQSQQPLLEAAQARYKPRADKTSVIMDFQSNEHQTLCRAEILQAKSYPRFVSLENYSVARIYMPQKICQFLVDNVGILRTLGYIKSECSIEFATIKEALTFSVAYKETESGNLKPGWINYNPYEVKFGVIDICDVGSSEKIWDTEILISAIYKCLIDNIGKKTASCRTLNYEDLFDIGAISRSDLQNLSSKAQDAIFSMDLGL